MAQEYDLNIYAPSDEVLTLSAYEWRWDGQFYTMDSSKYHTLRLEVGGPNQDSIDYLLQVAGATEVQEDLDEWVGQYDLLTDENATPLIKAWIDALPEYELEGY